MSLFTDPQIISAMINSAGTITAAVIATLVIGAKVVKRQELQKNLNMALADIEFLLRVEQMHCEANKNVLGASNKLKVRRLAKEQFSLSWSGKFTPSRALRYASK